jgi:hypothetical protein
VTGRWVYDAGQLHDAFNSAQNEIHPILNAEIVGSWTGTGPPMPTRSTTTTCAGTKKANDPATKDNQREPKHGWKVHPDLDGCTPDHKPPPGAR